MIGLCDGKAIQGQCSAVDRDRLPCTHSFLESGQHREGLFTVARANPQTGQVHHGLQGALGHRGAQRKAGEVVLSVLPTPGSGQLLLSGVGGDQSGPVVDPRGRVQRLLADPLAGQNSVPNDHLDPVSERKAGWAGPRDERKPPLQVHAGSPQVTTMEEWSRAMTRRVSVSSADAEP